MHFFLREHIYFHGNDIIFKGHVMHKTVIIGSIFNVPLHPKAAFLGPLMISDLALLLVVFRVTAQQA